MSSLAVFRRVLPSAQAGLASTFRRAALPTQPLQTSSVLSCSSAAITSSTSPATSSRPLSEKIVSLTGIDAEGNRLVVKGLAGQTLLQTLIRNGLETPDRHPLEELSSCNGNCEVTVANEWLEKLPPRTDAEFDRLASVSTTGLVNKNSRLGCQITLSKELEGLTFAMVEWRPYATP